MVLEIAAVAVALAFAVLVGFLVPTLIQVRKTVAESQQLVVHLNAEVPALVKEVRAMMENVGAVADQARDGVEHASVLLHAVGEVGESVQQVHKVVRGTSGAMVLKLASMFAGVKAASAVLKERVQKEGGESNGKR